MFLQKLWGKNRLCWPSGIQAQQLIHVCISLFTHKTFGMDDKFQLQPLWLTKPHLLLWKTVSPGRAISLI